MLVALFLSFLLFGSAAGRRNDTMNREVDEMLLDIESSIRERDYARFETNFHTEFDSEAWFKRYYANLTDYVLSTFLLRRFGDVAPVGEGRHLFNFMQSMTLNNGQFKHRSFDAVTMAWKKPFAIQSITQHGVY